MTIKHPHGPIPGVTLNTAPVEGDVAQALNELDAQLGRLEDITNRVIERLQPVVRMEPCEDNPKMPYTAGNCQLSQQVRVRLDRVAAVATAWEYLYQQIEL